MLTNLPKSQTVLITDSTDIALANYATPGQSNIGAAFSANIPAAGIIKIDSVACRVLNDATATAHLISLGLRINSVNYWFSYVNENGTSNPGTIINNASVGSAFGEFNGMPGSVATRTISALGVIDVTALSVPTGAQTVQLVGAYQTAASTLKGTVKQTRVVLRFDKL